MEVAGTAPALSAARPVRAPDASARDWLAVFSTMIGAFMALLDIQITNASLNDIEGAVGASSSEGGWISTSYLVAETIVVPLTALLGRAIGPKRYLTISAVLFVLFSVACALSHTLTQLILFRAGQGFTGGALIPIAVTTMRTRLPLHQQTTSVALFGFVLTFAPAIGPALGGWLTDAFSWHYLFYLNIAPGILLVLMLSYALDPAPTRLSELRQADWLGILVMAVGLSSLVVVLEEGQQLDWFGSDVIRVLSVTAVLGTAGFVMRQLLAPKPFIDLRLMGRRSIGLACTVMTVVGGVSLGSVYIIPLYCSSIQNYSSEQIGWVVMWAGLPQLALYPFMPWLMRHFDPRLLVVTGIVVFASSCFLNAYLTADVGIAQLIVPQILRGLGQPLFSSPLTQTATSGLSREEMPHVSSIFVMLRNLGGSVCIAMISTIVVRREQFHFSAIAEQVTRNSVMVQQRIIQLEGARAGSGLLGAHNQALAAIAATVRRQAMVMSFSDAFALIGVALVACLLSIALMGRPPPRTLL